MTKRALLLVDIQNDFLEGGSLAVPFANEILPLALKLIKEHDGFFSKILASQDWHPAKHRSFASQNPPHKVFDQILLDGHRFQTLWPDHCIQNTYGAELAPCLQKLRSLIDKIIYKGMNTQIDSYSAFQDNAAQSETELRSYLEKECIEELYVMGLATDFCVRFTSEDARASGFKTFLIKDGCRGIQESQVEKTYSTLQKPDKLGRRVSLIHSEDLLKLSTAALL